MAEIVNLRLARKAKKRADKAIEADANRARHGRTKAETQRDRMEEDRVVRALDGAKRDR